MLTDEKKTENEKWRGNQQMFCLGGCELPNRKSHRNLEKKEKKKKLFLECRVVNALQDCSRSI